MEVVGDFLGWKTVNLQRVSLVRTFFSHAPRRKTSAKLGDTWKQCVGKSGPFQRFFFSPSRWWAGWVVVVCMWSRREAPPPKRNVHDVVIVGVSMRIPITQDAAPRSKKESFIFSMKNTTPQWAKHCSTHFSWFPQLHVLFAFSQFCLCTLVIDVTSLSLWISTWPKRRFKKSKRLWSGSSKLPRQKHQKGRKKNCGKSGQNKSCVKKTVFFTGLRFLWFYLLFFVSGVSRRWSCGRLHGEGEEK